VKSLKNVVLALLVLTTIGGAVVAWRQYRELAGLRASVVANEERAALQKQIWDLRKANRALEDRLAGLRGDSGDDATAAASREGRPPEGREVARGPRGGPGGRGDPRQQMAAMRDLLAKPEVQALFALQQKAAIEQNYAALFRALNLTPEQAEKLKTLLAERQTTRLDVLEAARSQGIDPRENPAAFRQLMDAARDDVNNAIKSVIGESGFGQLQNYEQTMPQRNLVNDLQSRLASSGNPLNSAQAEQLVQILASNPPARPGNATAGAGDTRPPPSFDGPGPEGRGGDLGMMVGAFVGAPGPGVMIGGGPPNGAAITQQALAQAQAVLSTPQLTALQQMQQQQQAQQQLRQLVNEMLGAPPARGPGSGGGAPARPPGK
jgi:hypothetical protein